VLRRLGAQHMRVFAQEGSSNLFAYAFMLLAAIYQSEVNQQLLGTLKSLFYENSLDLTAIANHPFPELSNLQMKKLVVELVFQLQFADHTSALPKALEKHPVILHILVLFLKALLLQFGIGEAG
jgi:hypothetical protein